MKIGIVGWGDIARDHASHFAACGARLGGVVSRRDNLQLDVPVYRRLEEMLPHVDAITVAVPNHLHAPVCLQAIKAGMPAMVEKPLCITHSELHELEQAFQNLKAPIHLGFRLRWNPSMQTLKSRITNIRRVKCVYRLGIEGLADNKDWTRRFATSGGSFFTIGVHTLDLARWFADAGGQPLENIKATATLRDDSTDYPLKVSLSGTLPSGVEIVAGADVEGDADCCMQIEIDADGANYPDPALPPPRPEDEKVEYAALIANFARAVRANEIDKDYIEEILQTHRDLLLARDLADAD